MKWICKSAAQQIFSYLPKGSVMNYLCQRHITKSLPINEKVFLSRVKIAADNIERYLKYNSCNILLGKARFYEFGVGWDAIMPLAYYLMGVNFQTLVDIRPLLRGKLVKGILKNFEMHKKKLGVLLKRDPKETLNLIYDWQDVCFLKKYLGIMYKAPCDPRSTGFESESFDFISATHTLEHVPARDILLVMKECRRLLKKGGIACFAIDYRDHYSFFDSKISIYNFLKYPSFVWNFFNSSIFYQNRLRHRDYINIINNSGLQIVEDLPDKPAQDDIKRLKQIHLYKEFRDKYSLDEMMIPMSIIVARK